MFDTRTYTNRVVYALSLEINRQQQWLEWCLEYTASDDVIQRVCSTIAMLHIERENALQPKPEHAEFLSKNRLKSRFER